MWCIFRWDPVTFIEEEFKDKEGYVTETFRKHALNVTVWIYQEGNHLSSGNIPGKHMKLKEWCKDDGMCLRGDPVIVTGGDYYGCQGLLYQKEKKLCFC